MSVDLNLNQLDIIFKNNEKSFLLNLDGYIEEKELKERFVILKSKFISESQKALQNAQHFNQEKVAYEIANKDNITLLFNINNRLNLINRIGNDSVGEGNEKWGLYSQLKTYLALTCFDQLGRPNEGWYPFIDWISMKESNKKKEIVKEREKILTQAFEKYQLIKETKPKSEEIPFKGQKFKVKLNSLIKKTLKAIKQKINLVDDKNNDIKEFYSRAGLKYIYKEYNKLFSVRQSFFRFFDKIIPPENKEKLLSTIFIDDGTYTPPTINDYLFGANTKENLHLKNKEKEKKDWLFKCRNNYTHSAFSMEGRPFENVKVFWDKPYSQREIVFKNNKVEYIIWVRDDFFEQLITCVKVGIIELLRNLTSKK